MNIPVWLHRRLVRWARTKIRQRPDKILERDGHRYLDRWHIVKSRLFKVYLHRFRAPDQDWELHDHPFAYMSIVLRGQYNEERGLGGRGFPLHTSYQRPRRVLFRRAKTAHRISKLWGYEHDGSINRLWQIFGIPKPVTLVIAGPTFRRWGFFCENGERISPEAHEKWGCNSRREAPPFCATTTL